MKIAHLVCTFPPYRGGMGNSAYYFAKYITKHQHQVTVFTPDFGRDTKTEDNSDQLNNNLKIIRLKPLIKSGNAGIMLQLLWQLPKFDVVHLHYPFYGSAELVALVKLFLPNKLRLVLHYHMDNKAVGLKSLIFKLYKHCFLPLILRLSDEITCASIDYIKHSSVGPYFKNNQRKFSQVPFGVNIKKFKPATKNQAEPRILFVGALDRQHYFKGLDNLLQAFTQIALSKEELKLVVVGSGNMEDYYHQLAKDLKITKQVIFIHGADDDELIKAYQQSDFLVLPSINQSEAFGIVLLEAMACGKPVIASNLPGVRSVFKNGQQGLLVKPNDIEDLITKIKRLINNQELTKKLGDSARKLVENNYTWDKAADRLNIIYHRAKNSPKP